MRGNVSSIVKSKKNTETPARSSARVKAAAAAKSSKDDNEEEDEVFLNYDEYKALADDLGFRD